MLKKAFLFYLLISIVFTFPLVLNLQTTLSGREMDAYNYLWNIDTFWREILSFSNPFYTTRIFYPYGTELWFHTYAPFISLFALPFLYNLVLYLNLVVLISFPIAGGGIFLLVNYFAKNKYVSFISGFIYAFSPVMISFVESQHYYFLIAASVIPYAILMAYKYFEKQDTKHLNYLILLIWIVFFIDYYSFIFLSIILGIIFLWNVKLINYQQFILKSLLFLIFPLILLINSISFEYGLSDNSNYYSHYCSADLFRFILPSHLNPVLQSISYNLSHIYKMGFNRDTPSIYLGIFPLIFSLISVLQLKNKIAYTFFSVGIVFLFISLGPVIKFANNPIYFPLSPYVFFQNIPFMSFIDCPQRFTLGIQFAISVLVGLGLTKYKKYFKHKKYFLLILIIVMIEYLSFGMPMTKIFIPTSYLDIKSRDGNRTVLEVPSGIVESKKAYGYDWSLNALHTKQLYWQTIHNKPRIGGYSSRIDNSFYNFYTTEPILSDIYHMTDPYKVPLNNIYSNKSIELFLKKYNIGYIVFSPNRKKQIYENMVYDLFEDYVMEINSTQGFTVYVLDY